MIHSSKTGQQAKHINPVEGDADSYTVIAISIAENWIEVQENVNMNIKPTEVGNITDFEVIETK